MIVAAGTLASSSLVVHPASAPSPISAVMVDRQDGLELSMSLQKNVFQIGEPVNITFKITNIGNQTINMVHVLPEFDFTIYNSSNDDLYTWTKFKLFPMIVWETSLDPGKGYASSLVWLQTCNQTIQNSEGIPVSPGDYYIVGWFYRYSLETDPLQLSIGSPPLILTVSLVTIGLVIPVFAVAAAALTRKRQ
jgi:hypothetical protein